MKPRNGYAPRLQSGFLYWLGNKSSQQQTNHASNLRWGLLLRPVWSSGGER